MKNDFESLLIDLQSGITILDEFGNIIEFCQQIEDMYLFNRRIVNDTIYDDNPKTREEFIKKYNINIPFHVDPNNPNDINIFLRKHEYHRIGQSFQLPGFSDGLSDNLLIAFEVGYNKIYETLKKK